MAEELGNDELAFFCTMGLPGVLTKNFDLMLLFPTTVRGGKRDLNLSLPIQLDCCVKPCPAIFPHAECKQGKINMFCKYFSRGEVWDFSKALTSGPVLLLLA